MRTLFAFLVLSISLPSIQGSSQTLKAGLSYARFGIDGQNGGDYYTEYSKLLSKSFAISPSFHVAYGTKGNEFPYYLINKFSTGVDLNFFFIPVQGTKGSLRIGLGPSGRFFSGRNLSAFEVSKGSSGIGNLGPDGKYYVPYFYPKDRIKPYYAAIGYSIVIDSDLPVSTHFIVGVRIAYQEYSSSDTIASLGLNVGYRF